MKPDYAAALAGALESAPQVSGVAGEPRGEELERVRATEIGLGRTLCLVPDGCVHVG